VSGGVAYTQAELMSCSTSPTRSRLEAAVITGAAAGGAGQRKALHMGPQGVLGAPYPLGFR
jgi:hypothetical protein